MHQNTKIPNSMVEICIIFHAKIYFFTFLPANLGDYQGENWFNC